MTPKRHKHLQELGAIAELAADEPSGFGDRASSLLKNQAYEILIGRIQSGELVPGDKLSERVLSAELNMSKTPIKAALERLEEQGYVTLSPQRSATVRAMSLKEIDDHYELRMAVESFVVSRISAHLEKSAAEVIEETLRRQKHILTNSPNLEGWVQSDYDFHRALADATGNDEISKIIAVQRDRLFRVVHAISRVDRSVPIISHREHEIIYEHVRAGRAAEAIASAVTHLANGRRFMLFGGTYGQALPNSQTGSASI